MRSVLAGLMTMVITAQIRNEYEAKAQDPAVIKLLERHLVTIEDFLDVLSDLCGVADVIETEGEPPLNRDEDDRIYLHCVVNGDASHLVTYDRDLLDDADKHDFPILRPADFVQQGRATGIRFYGDSIG